MGSRRDTRPADGSVLFGILGLLGALVYFWRAADGFWEHAYALFQAVFWPAYLVYEAFNALGA